ncbi:MAG: alpha/beta hydrolase [Natrialbaceae archaeon]|nr:alpha/beta hydrolase [Natrialbaceae archaeon]
MTSNPATAMYRERVDQLSTTRGSGPPVVCAHGTLMDRSMFAGQLDGLSDAYQVTAYDLRARTEWHASGYDLSDLARDCTAVLDGIDADTAVIAGMSMGGFMALRLALEYPERVAGLVLIDTMATPHPDQERATYSDLVEPFKDELTIPADRAELASYELFGETTRATQPSLVDRWIAKWQTFPGPAVYHEFHSWLDRPDLTDRLGAVDVPVLIVHGEEDTSIEPSQAEPMLEYLPDADMATIPEAGHSSNLEQPERVNTAIREFLETN